MLSRARWRIVSERYRLEHEPTNAIKDCIENKLHDESGQQLEQCIKHDWLRPNVCY